MSELTKIFELKRERTIEEEILDIIMTWKKKPAVKIIMERFDVKRK